MVKESSSPNPIPVRNNLDTVDDLYCAAYLNYSEESFSDVSKNLLNALKEEYDNTGLGGSTRSFMANNASVSKVHKDIIDMNINGINDATIDKHVLLMQSGDSVMISVNLY